MRVYNCKEIAGKALRRAESIKTQQKRQQVLAAAGTVLGVAALCLYAALPQRYYVGAEPLPAWASVTILDGAAVGGYILVGVIGFSLGVGITLYLRMRRK